MDGLSVAEANKDLGTLVGRERSGEVRRAPQIGLFDEAENPGIVD